MYDLHINGKLRTFRGRMTSTSHRITRARNKLRLSSLYLLLYLPVNTHLFIFHIIRAPYAKNVVFYKKRGRAHCRSSPHPIRARVLGFQGRLNSANVITEHHFPLIIDKALLRVKPSSSISRRMSSISSSASFN